MGEGGSARAGLLLTPLDTLFFRDGRPFEAASRAASGLPVPQTLAGAVRTWLLREAGCDFEKLGKDVKEGACFSKATEAQGEDVGSIGRMRIRGPWFALNDGNDGSPEPLVPVPATLRELEGEKEPVRLDPLKRGLPGWRPPEEGMLPLWVRDPRPSKRIEGYLTWSGLAQYVEGDVPSREEILSPDSLFGFDHRTGIAVDPHRLSTLEGMIYAVSLLVPKPGISLYAEVTAPEEALNLLSRSSVPIPFGGEGRRVIVRRIKAVTWPGKPSPSSGGTTLLLTTPGLFDAPHWRPATLSPVSAAVSDYLSVSGWDLARGGPKPNRFAVAAGSVYFVHQPIQPSPETLCEGEDAALGWGAFVEGVWNHA